MWLVWIFLLCVKFSQEAYQETPWGEAKKVWPLWLWMRWIKMFEKAFKNTYNRENKKMQWVWIWIYWYKIIWGSPEDTRWNCDQFYITSNQKQLVVLVVMRKGLDMWYASDIKLCQCYGSYSYFLFPIWHKLMHTYSQSKQIRSTNKCKDNV